MLNCAALLLEANNIRPCDDEWLALMFLDALWAGVSVDTDQLLLQVVELSCSFQHRSYRKWLQHLKIWATSFHRTRVNEHVYFHTDNYHFRKQMQISFGNFQWLCHANALECFTGIFMLTIFLCLRLVVSRQYQFKNRLRLVLKLSLRQGGMMIQDIVWCLVTWC